MRGKTTIKTIEYLIKKGVNEINKKHNCLSLKNTSELFFYNTVVSEYSTVKRITEKVHL